MAERKIEENGFKVKENCEKASVVNGSKNIDDVAKGNSEKTCKSLNSEKSPTHSKKCNCVEKIRKVGLQASGAVKSV